METEQYSDTVKKLRSEYNAKYHSISDKALSLEIQAWLDRCNSNKGYLPGLCPKLNITKFSEISETCAKCIHNQGKCALANVLRNLASSKMIVELIEEKGNLRGGEKEAMKIIHNSYEPYIMLKEFVSRQCSGNWHSPLTKPLGNGAILS